MKQEIAYFDWSLTVECPHCHEDIDLVEIDYEYEIANKIFTNKWDKLKGYEVECPKCGKEFELEGVIY